MSSPLRWSAAACLGGVSMVALGAVAILTDHSAARTRITASKYPSEALAEYPSSDFLHNSEVDEPNTTPSASAIVPRDPNFLPNGMYSKNPYEDNINNRVKLQSALFRNIAGAAYRAYKEHVQWCGELTPADLQCAPPATAGCKGGGRPYKYSDFRIWSVKLLELYLLLQMEDKCQAEVVLLHDLLVDTRESVADVKW